MDSMDLDALRVDLQFLETERNTWDAPWKELSEYMFPASGRWLARGDKANDGSRSTDKIVDSTTSRARRVLAHGLYSGLTSPSRPWFKLSLFDRDLAEKYAVKAWLDKVEVIIRAAFQSSNIYNSLHGLFQELPIYGTGVMYVDAHPKSRLWSMPITVGEYYLATNQDAEVDTLFRRFWMSAKAMKERYGEDNLSEYVKELLRTKPYEQVDIVHVVRPRRKGSKTALPYESVEFEYRKDSKAVLFESGYHEFPYMCPRWDLIGWDSYGWGPGRDVLPDTKMLQEMAKDRAKAVKKLIDPPLTMPNSLKDRIKTIPGGINYVDPGAQQAARPLYQIDPQIQAINLVIEDTRAAIRDGFYYDLFLMLAMSQNKQPVTAREIAERHEEKLLQLGPVIERLHSELLRPLIDRSFYVLLRAGYLPKPPPEIQGQEMRPEFISTLAQAQKMVGTQSIEALASFTGAVAQFDPAVLDRVNSDEMVSEYADMIGAPVKVLRPDEEVIAMRQGRAKQQQEQLAMQQAQVAADSVKALSETQTDRQNALTDLLGGTR